ncbi:hypothetical protein [uncultured Campylobacter sp.]|uniref:hypothetical protein n=1 Tax=uncultured Campylobacter sp. TaxID=218934 RepID=UPI00262581C7|nr:hypothetical protein [uncultured Campylobacter sp.]
MKKFIAVLLAVLLVGCQCKQNVVPGANETPEKITAFFINDGKEYIVGEKLSYVLTDGSSLKKISEFYDGGYAKGLKREFVQIEVTDAKNGEARGSFSAFLNSAAGADVAKIKALADRIEIDEKKGEIEAIFYFDARVVQIKNLSEIMKPSDRLRSPIPAHIEVLPERCESSTLSDVIRGIVAIPVVIVGAVLFLPVVMMQEYSPQ